MGILLFGVHVVVRASRGFFKSVLEELVKFSWSQTRLYVFSCYSCYNSFLPYSDYVCYCSSHWYEELAPVEGGPQSEVIIRVPTVFRPSSVLDNGMNRTATTSSCLEDHGT